MRKYLAVALLFLATISNAQYSDQVIKNLELKAGLKLGGKTVTNIATDTTFSSNSDLFLPTQKAVKKYVDNAKIYINVLDYGAKGDGITDNSSFIQAAINTGNDVYIPSGVFIASNLKPRSNQKIYGQGTIKLKANASTTLCKPAIIVDSVTNVSIIGLTIDCNRSNTVRSTISNDYSKSPVGIVVRKGSKIKVSGCTISNSYDGGIGLIGTQDCIVSSNHIYDCYEYGICIRPIVTAGGAFPADITTVSYGNIITSNSISNLKRVDINSPAKCVSVFYSDKIIISNNNVSTFDYSTISADNYAIGIELFTGCDDFQITDNQVFAQWGISVFGSDNGIISNNVVRFHANGYTSKYGEAIVGGYGNIFQIEIVNSRYVTVSKNNLWAKANSGGNSISVSNDNGACDFITIEGNKMAGSDFGVHVYTNNGETTSSPSMTVAGGTSAGHIGGTLILRGNEYYNIKYSSSLLRHFDNIIVSNEVHKLSYSGSSAVTIGSELRQISIEYCNFTVPNRAINPLGSMATIGIVSGNTFNDCIVANIFNTLIFEKNKFIFSSGSTASGLYWFVSGSEVLCQVTGNTMLNGVYLINGITSNQPVSSLIEDENLIYNATAKMGGTINLTNARSLDKKVVLLQNGAGVSGTMTGFTRLFVDTDGKLKYVLSDGTIKVVTTD